MKKDKAKHAQYRKAIIGLFKDLLSSKENPFRKRTAAQLRIRVAAI